jgi:hypothetical protein
MFPYTQMCAHNRVLDVQVLACLQILFGGNVPPENNKLDRLSWLVKVMKMKLKGPLYQILQKVRVSEKAWSGLCFKTDCVLVALLVEARP